MSVKGTYESCDLYFCAFLKTAGVFMSGTKRDPKDLKKVYFLFDDDGSGMIEKLSMDFHNSIAKVPAQDYAYSIKTLKAMCHSNRLQ